MLTRLRFRQDFRIITRCFCDKPSDSDKIPPEKKTASTDASTKSTTKNIDKIQELLKSMKTEPRINESEYRANFATAPDRRKIQSDEIERKTEKIEESLTKAAGDVAKALGGDVQHTEAELLSKILGKINQSSTSLSDLIIGMKVDRSTDSDEYKRETRGQQVKKMVSKARPNIGDTRYAQRKTQLQDRGKSAPQPTTVNIFGGTPLGVFTKKEPNYGTKLEMWENLMERELTLATSQPPSNYFQKMILWTEQGKIWKFPINNEQGIEEEQNVHFSEHVFLDSYLEDWCPKKGPIRHFMELVCVGLSKNAFYTAKEKKDHIMWYKEYFESKKDLLTEVGAWETSKAQAKEASP